MNAITFDVTGSSTVRVPAERGVVHATVSLEGGDAVDVFDYVVASTDEVRRQLERLSAAGSVTWFSIDQVRRSARTPRNKRNEPLDTVHSASVRISAKFRDFSALVLWVVASSSVHGLSVGYIDWQLTTATEKSYSSQVRREAVLDAAGKAQDYADALALGQVQVSTIRDVRARGFGEQLTVPMQLNDVGSAFGAEPELELAPEHIELSAGVEARFCIAAAA